ncbi:SO_0444 family Cu/Zn efflux transporter [Spartinivicinus poritis]|uniref:SO_0444 family Cu/Zn efflux transporter n=1 Tax=Spartinivicinus poritis TaxID=2994640 RepID=A0ABT5UFE2_9GAMM|nr:SO_0444 family Cu/Zn efflux transporter [Spartinivicinus sp. A2-2]MDE1464188.1 SO_0444 family Cu/Zn efflux transporter [Spartinivicinus sp. A2-2]
MTVATQFWILLTESAPWLLLGFFMAGLIKVFVPPAWVEKHLKHGRFSSVFKAALIGAPLPLCSCGVIPAAIGVRRAGASKGATTAFMVATPETGVDSVSLSYAMMGPIMAIARPIAAIFSAITSGILVTLFENKSDEDLSSSSSCSSCCTQKNKPSCKNDNNNQVKKSNSLYQKLIAALKFATTDLLADTAGWLLIGLLGAALITSYVPQTFFLEWGNGVVAMAVMVLIGIPMYICATASTPLAAGLMLAGISPGAALVFMLAGPATNIATLGVIGRELGKRSLIACLVGVISTAIFSGLALDATINYFGWSIALAGNQNHHATGIGWETFMALLLVGLMARVYWQKIRRQYLPSLMNITKA